MFEATNDRRQLKSVLLAGAAGIAAVAASSAAYADESTPPADAQKWSWVVDAGGGVGSGFTAGKIDLLAPVWQDMDSLMFIRLGAGTSNKVSSTYNLGLGYRTKIDPEWILGLYAGWDGSRTDFDHHTFNQVALGAELMSADWDVRINGYIADDDQKAISNKYSLFIHDTRIAILQAQEAAYSGIDGEVGYRVFHTDDTDVRLFAGGYWFEHSDNAHNISMGRTFDFAYADLKGFKGRAEVNVFDLDELGPQSRLSLNGEIAHDDERGTTGFVGATVRIPLDVMSGGGAQALDDLDRRMIDPVRRSDNVLTQWDFNKPEPVVMYGPHMRSQPTNTLLYVDNSAGLGSYADPTTLHDSTGRTTVGSEHYINSFIVITDKQGDIIVNDPSDQGLMQSGQSLVGGGETFKVLGVNSGTLFTHDFAPGTTDPTIEVYDENTPVRLIDTDYDNVYGFSIEGYFFDAVYGTDVDHINISEMRIDGRYDSTGLTYGEYGIVLVQDQSQDLHAYMFGDSVSYVKEDGVLIRSNLTDGGTSFQYIDIINLDTYVTGRDGLYIDTFGDNDSEVYSYITVDNAFIEFAGNDGIESDIYAEDGAYVRQDITIHDSGVYDSGNVGMYFYAGSNSATAVQNVTIDPTNVNDNDYGITFYAYSFEGTVYQNGTLSDVDASYNYYGNIRITAFSNDANIRQIMTMYDVSANNSDDGSGLILGAEATNSGFVYQNLYVNGLDADSNYYDNIDVGGVAKYSGEVVQNVTLRNISATYSEDGYGLGQFAVAKYSGTVFQDVYVSGADLDGNYYDNVHVYGFADKYGYVGQRLDLRNAYASYSKTGNGIYMGGYANDYSYPVVGTYGGGTVVQHLGLHNVDANDNDLFNGLSDGVLVVGKAEAYSHTSIVAQYMDFSYIDTNDNYDGISINTVAVGVYGATFSDSTISYAKSDDNFDDGAQFTTVAFNEGSAQQNARLYNSEFDENGDNGVEVVASSAFVGFAAQYFKSAGNDFDFNSSNGLVIAGLATYGGVVEQGALMYFNSFYDNGEDGVLQVADSEGFVIGLSVYYSNVTQTVLSYYDSATDNGTNGWEIHDYAAFFGGITQLTYLYEDTLSYNGNSGMYDKQVAYLGANIYSDLYAVFSDFNSNGDDGLAQVTIDNSEGFYSYVLDHTLIYGSDFNDNGYNGFTNIADAFGQFSFDRQYITIIDSDFSFNDNNGAAFYAYQNYGPGSFGVAGQYVTIADSFFDFNGVNGLALYAEATNTQGRAEQHFNIYYSSFYKNSNDGIYVYAYAHDGAYVPGYACNYVQGGLLNAGGCAFVRETINIFGSDISDNGNNGIEMNMIADDYGAIYSAAGRPLYLPTLLLYNTTVNENGNDGLHINTYVGDASYLYQYVVGVSSHFDGNSGYGIYAYNELETTFFTGASQSIQIITLAGTYDYGGSTVNSNGKAGIYINTYAYGGYYTYSAAVNVLYLFDTQVDYNNGAGVSMYMESTGVGAAIQVGVMGYSEVFDNDGTGFYMGQVTYRDLNDVQYFGARYSYVGDNFGDGVYMRQSSEHTIDTSYQRFYAYSSSFSFNYGFGAFAKSESYDDLYALQSVTAKYTYFNDSFTKGGLLVQMFSDEDFAAGQSVFSFANTLSYNAYSGLFVYMGDTDSFGASQQVISVYDFAKYNGGTAGVGVYANFNGSYIAEQLVAVQGGYMAHNAYAGISIVGNFNYVDYGYDTQFVVGNLVKYSGDSGIDIHEGISGYNADLYSYTVVANNAVKYSGDRGISVELEATDDGYIWNDSYYGDVAVVIADNYVTDSGYHGIEVHLEAYDGGVITSAGLTGTFNTSIQGNYVFDSGYDGILVAANIFAGSISMGTNIGLGAANYVYNSYGYGIQVATGNVFGSLYSATVIANNHVEDSFLGGISVNNYEFDGTSVTNNLVEGNYVTGSFTFAGITMVDTGYFGTLTTNNYIVDNDVAFNYVGIGVYAYGDAGVFQYDLILNNTIAFNGTGVVGIDGLVGDSSFQVINVYLQNFLIGNGSNYFFFDNTGNQFVF